MKKDIEGLLNEDDIEGLMRDSSRKNEFKDSPEYFLCAVFAVCIVAAPLIAVIMIVGLWFGIGI